MPNLAPKNNCTGCTACMAVCPNNCIKMMEDENGFPYPQPDPSACIECGQCEQVCHVLNKTALTNIPSAYAAISKDENIRMESSSGGIFTELAKYFIEQGGVVYGAAYDEHFNVKHICVDN
ncbi:MAG: 4Fe-4S dicluster domain-containing protein, partial [Oscillospiraceae bacterium]|nr:4Fe-4S dicluster domain-containing protein [Oscillospiraceae bacterium]